MGPVERRGGGIELPATVCDGGELSDLCGDCLVADDEADVHGVCEVWVEVDADGDGDAALAPLWVCSRGRE